MIRTNTARLLSILLWVILMPAIFSDVSLAATVHYRVNTGGAALTGTPTWSEDSTSKPSPYVNAADTGNLTAFHSVTIDMTHPSVPAGTPETMFQYERWDPATAPEMQWNFPVTAGVQEVRLYFAETFSGTQAVGARVFDVLIEGAVVLDNYDVFAEVGGYKGVMRSFTVSTDTNLDLDFGHVTENPAIKGIEILSAEAKSNQLGASPTSVDFGQVALDTTTTKPLQLTNLGAAGDPDIVVDATSIAGTDAALFTDDFDDAANLTLAPGQSTTVTVAFTPTTTGAKSATINVSHSGANAPLAVALSGSGASGSTDPGAWESRPPAAVARQEVSYVHSGGKLYLAGGSTAHEAYDPATNTWKAVAALPQSIDHVQGVELNGLIYYVGGLSAWPGPHVNTVHIYNPATDTFSPGTPMARGRGAGGTAGHDGKIYYAGGLSDSAAVPWFDVYDPVANTWTQLPDMPRARDHFHAVVAGGKFYVTGGRNLDVNATTTATDAYDFTTGSWATGLAPLPTARGGFAAAALGDELVVIGGEGGGNTYDTVEAYNTATNTWRTLAPMPTARHGIQAATCNGGIHIAAGGMVQGGASPTTAHEVFVLDGATPCGEPPPPSDGTITYRVNSGGPSITATPGWGADSSAAPSPYVNAADTGNTTAGYANTIDMTHPSIPAGTPPELFQSERWDDAAAPEMQWNFPVSAGAHEVRLYFSEIYVGTQAVGARVFDVLIEGAVVLDNYDVFAEVGGYKGVMKSFAVSADSNLDIDFAHVTENPAIKGIEILRTDAKSNQLGASPTSVDFGQVALDTTATKPLQLTNLGAAGDPDIVVDATSIAGTDAALFTDNFDDAANLTLAPGQSTTVSVAFTPTTTGAKSATINVSHSGANAPLAVALSGSGVKNSAVAFGKSTLGGTNASQITSLQFGPDGRLYVAQQNGVINVYTVTRNGANSYAVTATETITAIQAIPNHNDDGTLDTAIKDRQVTGILVAGTAARPVIYAGSSDPRIGAGPDGGDSNLDTNSSMVSRLTWNGTAWDKLDLVRGLPRSEENHAINGLQLDSANNVLYVALGGNTNIGGPSNNFANLAEFALSAAILKIDLGAIGESTYDLPTLDDDSRAASQEEATDPFGGNDGKNQAKLVPGGPVQIHAPGFRNPYDLVIHSNGNLYTVDNGGNAGWGDVPVNEGPAGNCTNQVNEPGHTDPDTLHLVRASVYGGHPNPTRANMANTFNSNPAQSPVSVANAVECDYLAPGLERGNLTAFPASTNGLVEYTAANFGGEMAGDLLAAGFDNRIYRVRLNATGDTVLATEALFSSVDAIPLDLTVQGADGALPGTIWVGDIQTSNIWVFEPSDFSGGVISCTGADDPALDEDGDGFTNADEIDNATNPCSAADVPPDADGDKVSNLNDPDDDNDGRSDTSDPFAVDATNGTTTAVPLNYSWNNDASKPGGLLNLGFTGLMTNGTSNYESLFDPAKMTAGGAAGVTTVDQVSEGTALGVTNTQEYGLQFGIKAPTSGTFTAHTRILAPFSGITPQDDQSMGLFLGNGHQDNYVKLVVSANGGAGGVQFVKEVGGNVTQRPQAAVALPGPDSIDLFLTVDPVAGTVQPSYVVTNGGVAGPRTDLGGTEPIPAGWLTSTTTGLAVGIISTSAGAAPAFPATWDLIEVTVTSPTTTTTTSTTTTSTTTTTTASAPVNTAAPKISGSPRVGKPLKADNGTWSGALPMTFSYQWRRCDTTALNCVNIAGATTQSYTVVLLDTGYRIRVVVTATNSVGSTAAISEPTATVRF